MKTETVIILVGVSGSGKTLLQSQLDAFEPLDPDERAIELTADESMTVTVASSIIWAAIVA
jgi:gluconate kinase